MAVNGVGGPKGPNNVIRLKAITPPSGSRPAIIRRNLKLVADVIDRLRGSSWQHQAWLTHQTGFALNDISRKHEAGIRKRYQGYLADLQNGMDVRLPHYYFKEKGHVNRHFLDAVVKGQLKTDMHDIRGNYIIMRFAPSFADGMFPSQKVVEYDVALTRDVEELGWNQKFHTEEVTLGQPYGVIHFYEGIRMPKRFIPHVIRSIIVSEADGGSFKEAQAAVARSGHPIPVISEYEAILEAELLYRAELKYDLPTLLAEGRANLDHLTLEQLPEKHFQSLLFWNQQLERIEVGDVLGVNMSLARRPEEFKQTTWGVVVMEEGQKKVVLLDQAYPGKVVSHVLWVPRSMDIVNGLTHGGVFPSDVRRTGKKIEPQRIAEIGLAKALAELDPNAEVII